MGSGFSCLAAAGAGLRPCIEPFATRDRIIEKPAIGAGDCKDESVIS